MMILIFIQVITAMMRTSVMRIFYVTQCYSLVPLALGKRLLFMLVLKNLDSRF